VGYFEEPFTAAEITVLKRFFTNVDQPVFALINLPEVVKGALFARYSRSAKSVRRLFLDEFVTDPDAGIEAIAENLGSKTGSDPLIDQRRAESLYRRVFFEYGDDSVAQLGGVHLACEQASNILTKVLEWGRLASYLEQSTRYIAYDAPLGDGYRYFVPEEIEGSPLAAD
jgi:thymidylate synthase ThyX